MSRKRTLVATSTAILTATALVSLSACSSDSEEASVGGMTTCDEATISQTIEDQLAAENQGNQLFSLDGLDCGDGWAVAFPTVGPEETNAVTITAIYQAEGQFWIPKSPDQVCGTYDDANPDAYPADAEIPESLYQAGCRSN